MDVQHAEDHPVADAQQDAGHAEGLLPQPEEDPRDQPKAPPHQGAAQEGGGQRRGQDRQGHGHHDVQHRNTQVRVQPEGHGELRRVDRGDDAADAGGGPRGAGGGGGGARRGGAYRGGGRGGGGRGRGGCGGGGRSEGRALGA